MDPSVSIEPCLPKHLPQILDIYNHYVKHSVVTFDLQPRSLDYVQGTYDGVVEAKLPYVVAKLPGTETVVGYAYATQLRPRAAYAASVEIAIYLDPDSRRHGCGRALLTALLEKLRSTDISETRPHGIREVIAIVTLDPENDIRPFYLKHGFEENAHLKRVGCKFGRWLDTVYLQISLAGADGSG